MKSISDLVYLAAFVTPGLAQVVDLATAAPYGVLAPKSITSTGDTKVTGSVGVESVLVTGFPPATLTGVMQTDSTVVTTAVTDANNARIAALALIPTTTLSTLGGSTTLTPGVYAFAGQGVAGGGGGGGGGGGATGGPGRRTKRQGTGGGGSGAGGGGGGGGATGGGGGGVGVAAPIVFAGNLTLDGAGTYIFQGASSLTVEAGSTMFLTGGALSENVFWAIDSTVVVENSVVMKGTIMAASNIGIGSATAINGGIYSDASISIDDAKVGLVTPS